MSGVNKRIVGTNVKRTNQNLCRPGVMFNVFERTRYGVGTKFNEWSDRPAQLSAASARSQNQKRYPDLKCRYSALASDRKSVVARRPTDRPRCAQPTGSSTGTYVDGSWAAARSELLSAAERAYLCLIEADGWLDGAASALGRFRLSAPVPDSVVDILLSEENGSPLSLLRAATALVDLDDTQWLWAAEQYILQALWLTNGDGDWIEATCLLAAGQFYASNDHAAAVRFLEAARRAADGHRSDWPLPTDNIWRFDRTQPSKRPQRDIWATAYCIEHDVLMEAARELDPDQALRAVRAAYRLTQTSDDGEPDDGGRHAATAYLLGVQYAAVGDRSRATLMFNKCTVASAGMYTMLGLEAQLAAALLTTLDGGGDGSGDDTVLQSIAYDALWAGNGRLLAKATAARGFESAITGRPNKAYCQLTAAHRLAVACNAEADVDTERLYAAVCRTCTFLQVNFPSLNDRGFDLLAEPRQWTGHRRTPLITRSGLDGRMLSLNAHRFQDAIVNAEVRWTIQELNSRMSR